MKNSNRLLIDLSPLKSGGGVQLALNFIDFITQSDEAKNIIILVSDKFPFITKIPKNIETVIFPATPFKRFWAEHVTLKKFIREQKISHVFTFFGLGLPQLDNIRQVVSVAYPTICYDDSPFWQNLTLKNKIIKKFFQLIRLKRIATADAIIVETSVMQNRMAQQLKMPKEKFHIIPPVPTAYLKNKAHTVQNNKGRFLLLSGLNEHKNIWRLIEVAEKIVHTSKDITFVLSYDEISFRQKYQQILRDKPDNVLSCFEFVGSIPQNEIQSAYDEVDALLNVSDLESFSNNYMEAWLSAKPIIASDRDFARDILGSSAIYVEPHDANNIFDTLVQFTEGEFDTEQMVAEGKTRLAKLPTLTQRWEALKDIIFK